MKNDKGNKPNPNKIPPRKPAKGSDKEIGKRFWNDKPTKDHPLG